MTDRQDVNKLLAELVLGKHSCSDLCECWKIRKFPGVDQELSKIQNGEEAAEIRQS